MNRHNCSTCNRSSAMMPTASRVPAVCNASRFPAMCNNAPRCPAMCNNAPRCPAMCNNVPPVPLRPVDFGIDVASVRNQIAECKRRYQRDVWRVLCAQALGDGEGGSSAKQPEDKQQSHSVEESSAASTTTVKRGAPAGKHGNAIPTGAASSKGGASERGSVEEEQEQEASEKAKSTKGAASERGSNEVEEEQEESNKSKSTKGGTSKRGSTEEEPEAYEKSRSTKEAASAEEDEQLAVDNENNRRRRQVGPPRRATSVTAVQKRRLQPATSTRAGQNWSNNGGYQGRPSAPRVSRSAAACGRLRFADEDARTDQDRWQESLFPGDQFPGEDQCVRPGEHQFVPIHCGQWFDSRPDWFGWDGRTERHAVLDRRHGWPLDNATGRSVARF